MEGQKDLADSDAARLCGRIGCGPDRFTLPAGPSRSPGLPGRTPGLAGALSRAAAKGERRLVRRGRQNRIGAQRRAAEGRAGGAPQGVSFLAAIGDAISCRGDSLAGGRGRGCLVDAHPAAQGRPGRQGAGRIQPRADPRSSKSRSGGPTTGTRRRRASFTIGRSGRKPSRRPSRPAIKSWRSSTSSSGRSRGRSSRARPRPSFWNCRGFCRNRGSTRPWTICRTRNQACSSRQTN